ncbi:MAG: hypothetical protein CMH57_11615 [Myxococcales bacterium]|nr:hypothetical protein [Myxococcales bacterium]
MTLLDRITDRALAWLGLDLDIDLQMEERRFSPITPTLTLGARPGPEHVAALKEAGITHVASCLGEAARPKVAFLQPHFHTLFLTVHDGVHEEITSMLPELSEFAAQASRGDSRLLVHCEVGVSRSATMVIALLMERERGRFFETFRDVRARRPQILPNVGFASQLQRLEHQHHPLADGEPSSLARYLHQVCKVPVEIEVLQDMLERHEYDALAAIRAIFGEDVPRVIQGMRL